MVEPADAVSAAAVDALPTACAAAAGRAGGEPEPGDEPNPAQPAAATAAAAAGADEPAGLRRRTAAAESPGELAAAADESTTVGCTFDGTRTDRRNRARGVPIIIGGDSVMRITAIARTSSLTRCHRIHRSVHT